MSEPVPFRLREFCFPEDYEAVKELWSTAGPGVHLGRSDTPEEIQKKILRDPDLFLLAEVDGQVIGTVLGGFDGRRGIIYHLAVNHAYRKQGIGEALMDEVEHRMFAKGCIRSYLLVTHDNTGAQHFYENRGWERMDLFVYGKNFIEKPEKQEEKP